VGADCLSLLLALQLTREHAAGLGPVVVRSLQELALLDSCQGLRPLVDDILRWLQLVSPALARNPQ
jgi:hypothetical protein